MHILLERTDQIFAWIVIGVMISLLFYGLIRNRFQRDKLVMSIEDALRDDDGNLNRKHELLIIMAHFGQFKNLEKPLEIEKAKSPGSTKIDNALTILRSPRSKY